MSRQLVFLSQVEPTDEEIAWAGSLADGLRTAGFEVFQEWPRADSAPQEAVESALRRSNAIVFLTDSDPTDIDTFAFEYGVASFGNKALVVVTPPGVTLKLERLSKLEEHQIIATSPSETAQAVTSKLQRFREVST